MAYTLTLEEINRNITYANAKAYDRIKEYVNKNNYANNISRKYINKLQEYLACRYVLLTWEQGNFTNQEYINYLTSLGYMKVVQKIKTL